MKTSNVSHSLPTDNRCFVRIPGIYQRERDWVGREAANEVAWGTGDPAGRAGIVFALTVHKKWGLRTTQCMGHMQSVCVHFGAINSFHVKHICYYWKATLHSKHTEFNLSIYPIMKCKSYFNVRLAKTVSWDQKDLLSSVTDRCLQKSANKHTAFNYGNLQPSFP